MWGRGDCGQLGLGDYGSKQTPVLLTALPHGTEVLQVSGSSVHTEGTEGKREGEEWGGVCVCGTNRSLFSTGAFTWHLVGMHSVEHLYGST